LFNQALLSSAFIFLCMIAAEDEDKPATTGEPAPKLATEGPLFGKDEQGRAIERMKKLAKEALEKWQQLTGNIIHKHK
jgi:hypothetical protein